MNPNVYGPSAQPGCSENFSFWNTRLPERRKSFENQRAEVGGQRRVFERRFWAFFGAETSPWTVPILTFSLRAIARIERPSLRSSSTRSRSNTFRGRPTARFIPLWLWRSRPIRFCLYASR